MKKLILTIGSLIIASLGLLFYERPEPPFGAVKSSVVSETACEGGDGTNARFFAEVEDGIVLRVIVARPEFLNTGRWGSPDRWVETCYGDKGSRKNYAGQGYIFDKTQDGFVAPKPDKDAVLDKVELKWISPLVDEEISNTASR